jgi:dihydroxyacetone kinase-like protein
LKTGFLKEGRNRKMKKIINDPNQVVNDMLAGMAAVNPEVCYDREGEVIYRRKKTEKVGIVSGGGSGHEPAHAGYVGMGMLDAAVAGNVFASPDPARILNGIEHADSGRGVLLVIKNYSGDIMNFEMAADLAADMDIPVRSVVVRDDVAVKESTYSTGRRGIAGTVFVHKIAGARAEAGGTLEEVAELAQRTADNVRSFGVSLSSCILPAVGAPGFAIGEGQMELGMGIHGEPGIEQTAMKQASEIAEIMVEKITADLDYSGAETAVIINGLGGTPLMELYILAGEIDQKLRAKNITPVKYLTGNFMTSLEMAGASMSMLRLDDEMKQYLTAPCDTMAWKEG